MNIENKFLLVCGLLLITILLHAPLTLGAVPGMNRRRSSLGHPFAPPLITGLGSSSVPVDRVCRLYNRKARADLVINRDKISAIAFKSDERGEIGLESVMKEDVVRTRIRGIVTGNYLCFNHKGRVVSKPKGRARGAKCEFTEVLDSRGGSRFVSALNPNWALGFNQKGQPMLGGSYEVESGRCPHCFSFYKTPSTSKEGTKSNAATHNMDIGLSHPGLNLDFWNQFPLAMPGHNGTAAAASNNGSLTTPTPHRRRHRKKHNGHRRHGSTSPKPRI